MITVYTISLATGILGQGWWLVAERTRGGRSSAVIIRRTITVLTAFGIGGLSASYGGVGAVSAFLLAAVAAVALVVYGDRVTD